ncbi:MAG: hypothetical protein OP8BY_0094 [Candidatus Saccharicenans subterraneus]|uniref:Uncharacterized protein n=1 Tax=Candidatus Saccharicenans subterraneus TaxID=2508984 RepID=A0A3E2BLT6_9BACT|nr:MAG: hypothetical protein OP8BY_0094 [Candidatus Saccharicenans subterraneum]
MFTGNRLTRFLAAAVVSMGLLLMSPVRLSSRVAPQHWTITINIFPTTITFPAADPDLEPVVAANTPVHIQVTTSPPNRRWEVTIRAEGNLVSASGQVIPISTISWRASPNDVFRDGVLAAGQSLVLAQERGQKEADLSFYFQNSWDYVAGEYTQVITFTASLL